MAGLVVFTAQASRLLPPQDDPVPRFQRRKALAWSEDTVAGGSVCGEMSWGRRGWGGMLEADRSSLFAQFL